MDQFLINYQNFRLKQQTSKEYNNPGQILIRQPVTSRGGELQHMTSHNALIDSFHGRRQSSIAHPQQALGTQARQDLPSIPNQSQDDTYMNTNASPDNSIYNDSVKYYVLDNNFNG